MKWNTEIKRSYVWLKYSKMSHRIILCLGFMVWRVLTHKTHVAFYNFFNRIGFPADFISVCGLSRVPLQGYCFWNVLLILNNVNVNVLSINHALLCHHGAIWVSLCMWRITKIFRHPSPCIVCNIFFYCPSHDWIYHKSKIDFMFHFWKPGKVEARSNLCNSFNLQWAAEKGEALSPLKR